MKLNRIVIAFILVLPVFNSCKNNNNFIVSGIITHAEGKSIFLEQLHVSSSEILDSAKIDKKGLFKFEGHTSIPSYFLLKMSADKFIYLLVDSAENITVNADYVNFSQQYDVEGSLGSILVKELNDKLNNTRHKLDSLRSLNKLYLGNPEYETMKIQWNEEYKRIVDEQVTFSQNFVMNNPFSMASILALYQKFSMNDPGYIIGDLQTMKTAASALHSIYPESDHVKALYANTRKLMEDEKNAKIQKYIQENGSNSPDIVLPDPDGKEIALSSLLGKVVLVQFWAAADGGSRIINPVLAELYAKYKRKGFEIYQVSIDENRIEWVDAIDNDKLTWINVGDMKGSVSATSVYNVKTIPYNYLLDKDGLIIAQDLKGPALDRALKKLLN